jgi:DNA-directed RNA polymerase subunit RPC12/RpoP
MQCDVCGKRFSGSGLSLTLDGNQKTFCADCYGKIREEYNQKKNCDDCRHFDKDSCELTGSKLTPTSIGYRDYFVQAEKCVHYKEEEIESEEKAVENLEKAGRYMEAAQECEKLGMLERAERLRRKQRETTLNVNSLIGQLADRGQTLTYHCCHCGTPLRVGAESEETFKVCPNCGYSLEAIDLAKLINQHM